MRLKATGSKIFAIALLKSLHRSMYTRFIVGGFANGTVGVWDLQTKSPLLSSGDTLYPIWSFYAHACAVTGKVLLLF